jgi:sec-independent protein translocase protein TatA
LTDFDFYFGHKSKNPGHPDGAGEGGVFMELSPMHLLLILVIVVILFGGRRIPELMKGLGQGIREFKDGMRDQPPTAPPASGSQPTTTSTPPAADKK